ncbi:MAG: HEAT repeat domain-containing protein [Sedimentisphaerales bacterium]|nr:HEAT repeat domain-containing protein [Sedimentisphaerales bacterium]
MEQPQVAAAILEKVKTYDFGKSRAALSDLSDEIRKASGKPEELKKYETSLIEVLKSDTTFAGKQYACRELSIIGTDQSVPTLAAMLPDKECSDIARFALERIPGEAADKAFLDALPKAEGKAKIGIVNSLGERGVKPAAGEIAKLVDNADALLAGAAISALGKIGGPDALQGLDKAAQSAPDGQKMLVYDAYLKVADTLAAGGDKAGAQKIWVALNKQGMPSMVRTAAMQAMVKAAQGGR